MANVVTFTDFRPIPRFDAVKWTEARIEEAAALAGPWTEVEVFAVPDYPDPEDPPLFSFTTDEATVTDGWYRLVWLDPLLNTSVSEAISSSGESTLPLSVGELRGRSELIRTRYPATPYDAQKETDLANAIQSATALVESLTCRKFDATMPEELVPLAIQATVWKTEQVLLGSSMKSRRSTIGRRALKSMTAGPYSETYFGPDEAAKTKRLDLDPEMHDLLWALATEECRERWLELWGEYFRPAARTTEIGWNATRGY